MNLINYLVLVIEDEDSLREAICELIRDYGLSVIAAENGVKGIKLAHEQAPHIIFCDIMLPEIDGYEVFRRIKEIPDTLFDINSAKLKSSAFIFLSAKATRQDIRIGMNLGADDYIAKPFSKEELFDCINARLKRIQKSSTSDLSLINDSQKNECSKLGNLTKKETDIFNLIAQGYTSERIASLKFVSKKTIENHRTNISRKLNLNGPNSLVTYALRTTLRGNPPEK